MRPIPPSSRPHAPVLGLTGAVGAGKSTAARIFADHGCRVLDVDRMGHDVLDDAVVAAAIAREFGSPVLAAGGRIDRTALAHRVFGDAAALERLESFVHPAVRDVLGRELDAARRSAPRAVVIDCALLFEGGLETLCDATIAVDADDETRARRVAASRGWTRDEMRRREAAQLPAAEKRARADRVLANGGSADDLRRRIGELLDELAPTETRGPDGKTRPAAGRQER